MGNKKIKVFFENKKVRYISSAIFIIILGYFFTPLQEPINNFVLSKIFGEPEINIYISRNYVTNLNESVSWNETMIFIDKDIQIIVLKKILSELPNKRSYDSVIIDTYYNYKYNYLIYIKNDGDDIAEDIHFVGRLDVNNFEVFDVDALIDINPKTKGGLYPNEKTFRVIIKKLEPRTITSFRISTNETSEIFMDCSLKRGKCNYGINNHMIIVPDNLPFEISASIKGKEKKKILIPDYRNKIDGSFFYNLTTGDWVNKEKTQNLKMVYSPLK